MPVSPIPCRISRVEEVHHWLGPPEDGARPAEVEVHRYLVVGVDPGCHDDVDVGDLLGDRRDTGDVPSQADHREVDQGADPVGLELLQFGHGTRLLGGFVPFCCGLLDLGAQHEDVLVHEGLAEEAAVHRSSHRVDLGHRHPLPTRRWARAGIVVVAADTRRGWRGTMSQQAHSGPCEGIEAQMVG